MAVSRARITSAAVDWLMLSMLLASISAPVREAQARAGAGRRPVGGDVLDALQGEVLHRARHADPVADLGASGIELLTGQGSQGAGVLLAQGTHHAAVEV